MRIRSRLYNYFFPPKAPGEFKLCDEELELADDAFIELVVANVEVPRQSDFDPDERAVVGGDVFMRDFGDGALVQSSPVRHKFFGFCTWQDSQKQRLDCHEIKPGEWHNEEDWKTSAYRLLTEQTALELAEKISRIIDAFCRGDRWTQFYKLNELPQGLGAICHICSNDRFSARLIKTHDAGSSGMLVTVDWAYATF